MPEPYLDSSIVGFNHQDALDLQVDTYQRLSPILNLEDKPAIDDKFAMNLSVLNDGPSDKAPVTKINLAQALISDDPTIKSYGQQAVENKVNENPEYKYGLGRTYESPYDDYAKKFMGRKFSYSTLRDNEDFYYRNTWGDMSTVGRMWRTPYKMLARIVPQALMKLGAGLGYVGSMLLNAPEIGTDEYWADVADNNLSHWFESMEQKYKDRLIPVYKQAGFDDKGFFSKLFDSAFWNDEVADAVAFLGSAAIPGMAATKLGALGKLGQGANLFGKAFSATSKLGKAASWAGVGSWAELSTWTFNTAMESAMEGAGVFKEMNRRMKALRADGHPDYVDLTDEDIRERAGHLAGNTVRGNFMVLALSNAWENTLFFKPFKNIQGRAGIQVSDDFVAGSRTIAGLERKNPFASALSRTSYYSRIAGKGAIAEGLWEENAQLAIQRMNEDEKGSRTGLGEFLLQLGRQTGDALAGRDTEAATSIGLGALIGIGAGVGFSKVAGERRKIIANTRQSIDDLNTERQNLFDINDIWERNTDNTLKYENNRPVVNKEKLARKAQNYEDEFGKIIVSNEDQYFQTDGTKFSSRTALSNYVRSLQNIGEKNISNRFAQITPENATIFGMNPNDLKEESKKYASLVDQFEKHGKDVEQLISVRPTGMTLKDYTDVVNQRKSQVYRLRADNTILSDLIGEKQSALLENLNKTRNLQNASLAQFPVDVLNSLIEKKKVNDQAMKDPSYDRMSDLEKQYHVERAVELDRQIEQHKANNEVSLQDSRQTANGYYVPTTTTPDGKKVETTYDKDVVRIQRNLAHYDNIIDKNNYFDKMFSDPKTGFTSYQEWKKNALDKELEAAEQAAAAAATTKVQQKYREIKPGDFKLVTDLVAKMVFGRDQVYTPSEIQLKINYADLINELLPQYESIIENMRANAMKSSLESYKNLQSTIGKFIADVTAALEDQRVNLQYLLLTLKDAENKGRVKQKEIKKAIADTEKNINDAEKRIAQEEVKLAALNETIAAIEQDVAEGSFRKLWEELDNLKEQRDKREKELDEAVTLLAKIKKILRDVINVAKKLIPGFNYKQLDRVLGDEIYGDANREAYSDHPELIEAYTEIRTKEDEKAALQKTITDLEALIPQINAKVKDYESQVNLLKAAIDKYFSDIYLDLTKPEEEKEDPEISEITENLTSDVGVFPTGGVSTGGIVFDPDEGFDFDDYLRPLATKFITSTAPFISATDPRAQYKKYSEAPKNVQDYYDFVEFYTNPANQAEIAKKLSGNQDRVQVLIVTRNNVEALGLTGVLSDRAEFFKNTKPEETNIEIIPVISHGGYLYYTDKKLNRLQRVGDKNAKVSKDLVRTVLRNPVFRDDEVDQYIGMYLKYNLGDVAKAEADMKKSIKAGVDFRKRVLESTKTEPQLTYQFRISRGIPNKKAVEGEAIPRNPVSAILPEDKINGQSVRVYSVAEVTINGETVRVPVGRPFIYTGFAIKGNTIHEQLHAADNQKLSQTQVNVIVRVLNEMIKDHVSKVIPMLNTVAIPSEIKKRIGEVGIENLTFDEKKSLYLALTKSKPTLYNSNYTNWLSSIVFFQKREKDDKGKYKPIGINQIYMKGHLLVLGNSGVTIDMTRPESADTTQVRNFLSNQFHNIKYFNDSKKANKTYLEFYLDGAKLETRSWKTYAHYLLMEKTEDGEARETIPVTTGVKSKEQHDLEPGNEPYYTYLSRGIIIKADAADTTQKKPKDNSSRKVDINPKESVQSKEEVKSLMGTLRKGQEMTKKGAEKAKASGSATMSMIRRVHAQSKGLTPTEEAPSKEETKKEEPIKEEKVSPMMKFIREDHAAKKGKKPPTYNNDDDTDSLNNRNFRLAKTGVFRTEEDLDALVADIKRMIPQFPVERLKKVLLTSNGLEAWGQFINNTIFLYESAEKGTGYHEVFEAVANRLLTDKEWNAIQREFNSRKGSFIERETGRIIPYKDASARQAKEQMAEEFMDFKLTGKLPSYPQTRSFIKIIWDFIKSLFGARTTIAGIFDKIDQGKFSDTVVRSVDRFEENYRLKGLPAEVKRDVIDGMSDYMFFNMFLTPKSLVKLDEIDYRDDEVYEPIRKQFEDRAIELANQIKTHREGAKQTETQINAAYIQNRLNAIDYINYTLDNWGQAVETHKQELRHFGVKFEVEDEDSDVDEMTSLANRNDYQGDHFKPTRKKSASRSVRFLFTTLVQSYFNRKGETTVVNGRQLGKTRPRLNSVFMNSLANHDDFMLKALEKLKGISDFDLIEQKLLELAGQPAIQEMENPEKMKALLDSMTDEQAVWTSLYIKLFGHQKEIDEESAQNLKVKFHNYVSKTAPQPYIFLHGAGESNIVSATTRAAYENLTKSIISSILQKKSILFVKKKEKGRGTYYTASSRIKDKIGVDKFDQKAMEDFIKVLGLNNEADNGILNSGVLSGLDGENYNHLRDKLLNIRNGMSGISASVLNLKGLNVYNYMMKEADDVKDMGLVPFLDTLLDVSELGTQYPDYKNQPRLRHIVPSFISRIVDDFNILNKERMLQKYPQLGSYFAQDGIVMSKLYNAEGERDLKYKINIGYMSAVKNANSLEGKSITQLQFHDKYWVQFNASLAGLYYTLPADSETEWLFNFGEFVSFSEDMFGNREKEIVDQMLLPKLRSEIDVALQNDTSLLEFRAIHSDLNRPVGKSLRFFKDILPRKLVDKIHKEIDSSTPSKEIVSKHRKAIKEAIRVYLDGQVNATKLTLQNSRLVKKKGDTYITKSLNFKFLSAYGDSFPTFEGETHMNESQYTSLIQYQKINSMIGMWEQFKLFYGDPAQYKDWEKRAKSELGPVEPTFYERSNKLNDWLTSNKNFAELGEEKVGLGKDTWFKKAYNNDVSMRTVDDIIANNVRTVNDLQQVIDENTIDNKQNWIAKFVSTYINSYTKSKETDGQSAGTLGFIRHLMIKSGWRWTDEQENYYQYDTSLMRWELSQLDKSHPHYYDYRGNSALKTMDEKIVKFYEENPPEGVISPLKTLMNSQDKKGRHILLKHAIYPMSYQLAKGREMLDVYIDMLKNGDDIINFKSAQKVGLQVDKQGEITPKYPKIPYVDPKTKKVVHFSDNTFEKNDLNKQGNPQIIIDMRTIGIQVETQTSNKRVRIGSQLTKDGNLNLFENGVPVDFEGDIDEWNALTEKEKLTYENYRLVYGKEGSVRTLENLKTRNAIDTISRMGIKWKYNNGEIETTPEDLTRIRDFIHDEMQRLQIDENSLENVDLDPSLKTFKNPVETLPSYQAITNALWALSDRSITSMRVNGKGFIQVSSAFFNEGSRQASYYDESTKRWIVVDNKEDFDRLQKEGKKMVMTSSELQFYRRDPETGKTLAMEVYLPDIYIQKVNKFRAKKKDKNGKSLPPLTSKELMDYLNDPKNRKLLEGIGFRIPTQDTSSIDFFVIKGFLPPAFGSSIVVPSGLTTKSGGDFDVDKLNSYLNNFLLNKEGYPTYEEMKDDGNSTAKERYITTIRKQYRKYNVIKEEMKGSSEFKRMQEMLDENEDILEEMRANIGNAIASQTDIYKQGKAIFRNLDPALKQQYWDVDKILDDAGLGGEEKVMFYLKYTKDWIKQFDKGAVLVQYTSEADNGTTITANVQVNAADNIEYLQAMVENYEEFLDKAGITKEIRDEYYTFKEDVFQSNTTTAKDFQFKIASIIAEFNNLMSFKEFDDLPLELQNTQGALQNAYFQSLRNILEKPENFTYLLFPNSIDHIKKMRETVQKAKDPKWIAEENKEINYSNFVSTEVIAEKRDTFSRGKNDIPIFAVAMTSFANSQITGIGIVEGLKPKPIDNLVFNILNDGYIDLPFSDVQMQVVDGKKYISISSIRDKNGNMTMSKLSSYINGAVDIVKEPYIIEMGMHNELAPVYTLMERMQLTGETTALFLYQPAVREFLRELLFIGKYSQFAEPLTLPNGSAINSQTKLIKYMINKYSSGADQVYDPNFRFTDDMMINLIRRGEEIKADPTGKKDWTPEERNAQYHALVNYLKMKSYSRNLLENIMASNHDTASIRSPWIMFKKENTRLQSKKGNMIGKITSEGTVNGADALIEGTFVKTDIKLLNMYNDLFAKTELFALQRENPRTALLKIAGRVLTEDPFMPIDDFVKVMRLYESSMIDSMVNELNIEAYDEEGNIYYEQMYELAKELFTQNGKFNLKQVRDALYNLKFKDSEEYVYREFMDNNFFLSSLNFYTNEKYEIDLVELVKKPAPDDVLTRERITEGIRALSEISPTDYPGMHKFFKALIYGAYIQHGIKYSRKSFVDLIPSEILTPITKAALDDIDIKDFRTLNELVQRVNWGNDSITPIEPQRAVTVVSPNATDPTRMKIDEDSTVHLYGWKTPPNVMSQTFFGKRVGKDIVPNIRPMFIYAGTQGYETSFDDMPNIIGVTGIHPDYLVSALIEEENWNGQRYQRYILKPDRAEINKMRKKNDTSFLYTQLYKKVGVENPDLGRKLVVGKNKKSVSYLYKPINKFGIPGFGEMRKLLISPQDTVVGDQSIIEYPPFTEYEDVELLSMLDNDKRMTPANLHEILDISSPLVVKSRTEISNPIRITMNPENISKVEQGLKTTTVRSSREADRIGIGIGKTEKRMIGPKEYMVTNRGYLSIKEAGGAAAMVKSEGFGTVKTNFDNQAVKVGNTTYYVAFAQTKNWLEGKGRIYVYDIKPIEEGGETKTGNPDVFQRTSEIIRRKDLRNNPTTLYIFGDNNERKGLGGQAKEMRGEPNAFGISTKKYPDFNDTSYMTDKELDKNKEVITSDINKIIDAWNTGKYKRVILPRIGYGLAELPTRAPKTWEFLQEELNRLENTILGQPQAKPTEVVGINIYSKSDDELGRALTNPTSGSKKDGKDYYDVETNYKELKSTNPDKAEALKEDMETMYELINAKFRQNPELIDQINERGGLPFIQASTHTKNDGTPITQGSRWEGKGMKSNFIKVLARSYETVAKELGKFVGPISATKTVTSLVPKESKTPEFDKLPFASKTKNMVYTGVGSRETPKEALAILKGLAEELENLGYTGRTGDAKGADQAIREGAQVKEVYTAADANDQTRAIAREIHPNPSALSPFGLDLMARNTNQVFGEFLDVPSDFLIAWTAEGWEGIGPRPAKGGTNQAIDMAARKGIPVVNIKNPNWRQKLDDIIGKPPPFGPEGKPKIDPSCGK